MTVVHVYIAIDAMRKVLEVDTVRVMSDDTIWSRMHSDGADRVLSASFEVPAYAWPKEDENTPEIVAQNLARMHFCDTGDLHPDERPAIALLEKKSGKWGCTCTTCNRIVCKPMDPYRIPLLIMSGEQHLRISH